jgi:hypothetical protein
MSRISKIVGPKEPEVSSGSLRELKERGYSGSKQPVFRLAQERRTEPHPCIPKKYRADSLSEPKARKQGKLPAPLRLAWILIRDPDTLGPDENIC